MLTISVPLVFLAGLLSFLSPCVLPLVPIYLGYLSGAGLAEEGRDERWRTFAHALFFVGGFTLVFVVLFGVPATLLGRALAQLSDWIGVVGGLVLIVFGLYTMRLLRLPWLDATRRIETGTQRMAPGYLRSALFGVTFAAGWTPCIGPLLGTVVTLAFAEPARAMPYLLVYALGLAIPFLVVAAALTQALDWLRRLGRHARAIELASGILMVGVGFALVTGMFTAVNGAIQRLIPDWLLRFM